MTYCMNRLDRDHEDSDLKLVHIVAYRAREVVFATSTSLSMRQNMVKMMAGIVFLISRGKRLS